MMIACDDRMYPIEPKIKDNIYSAGSASYLDIHLEIDNEDQLTSW